MGVKSSELMTAVDALTALGGKSKAEAIRLVDVLEEGEITMLVEAWQSRQAPTPAERVQMVLNHLANRQMADAAEQDRADEEAVDVEF